MMLAVGPDALPIGVVKLPPMPGVAGFVEPGEEELVPVPVPVAVPFPVLVPAALRDLHRENTSAHHAMINVW